MTKMTSRRQVGFALAAFSAATFGALGYFAHLLAAQGFSVISSLALRFSVAAFCLWIFDLATRGGRRRDVNIRLVDRLTTVALGAVGYGLSACLFFISMERTSTGLANILLFQNPLVVLALTWITQRHQAVPWLVIVAVIGGLVLTLWPRDTHLDTLGVLAGFGSAIWYGCYLFLTDRRSQTSPPQMLTLDTLTGCALAFLALGAITGQLQIPQTAIAWWAVFGQSVICTIIPVIALFAAFKHIGARDATLASSIEPIVTVAIGVAFLNEPWSLLQLAGSALIIGGIIVFARKPKDLKEIILKPAITTITLPELSPESTDGTPKTWSRS